MHGHDLFPKCNKKVYGFGFDERSGDYKVVLIFAESKTGVYSLKTGCWKTISDFPGCWLLRPYGNVLNDSLHWTVHVYESVTSEYLITILCLDLLNETYGEIEKPDYGTTYSFNLGILQGCLCVLADFRPASSDLWIMKEYGVIDSWAKLYTIPYLNEGFSPIVFPLSILSSGELLISGLNVYLYNPSDGTCRYACVQRLDDCYLYPATYVDSLVSPHLNTVSEF